ncbi:unnamed protein product [Hyaloperonospora brassicae]|uniref:RxLR effector protein n=1 Tax=Hyaloperonospora brassicae TaxID=162125 RepID=A0AAV0UAY7_HYABA|nr:unnamed protein product [Hyaloperonospora brassicae]
MHAPGKLELTVAVAAYLLGGAISTTAASTLRVRSPFDDRIIEGTRSLRASHSVKWNPKLEERAGKQEVVVGLESLIEAHGHEGDILQYVHYLATQNPINRNAAFEKWLPIVGDAKNLKKILKDSGHNLDRGGNAFNILTQYKAFRANHFKT